MDALEETADFLQSCSEFFQNSHAVKIKHAYAEVFAQLLEPIASVNSLGDGVIVPSVFKNLICYGGYFFLLI